MDDSEKSFAYKHGLHLPKKQKTSKAGPSSKQTPINKPVVPRNRLDDPLIKSYQSTKKHQALLDGMQTQMRYQLTKPVGHSTILRAMIQLASTDSAVRHKLMALIQHENVQWGAKKK